MGRRVEMAGAAGLEPIERRPRMEHKNLRNAARCVNSTRIKNKTSGQQTPRRWGWGTPLKKRTATRTSKLYVPQGVCQIVIDTCPAPCTWAHLIFGRLIRNGVV